MRSLSFVQIYLPRSLPPINTFQRPRQGRATLVRSDVLRHWNREVRGPGHGAVGIPQRCWFIKELF